MKNPGFMRIVQQPRHLFAIIIIAFAVSISACSSTDERTKPAELVANSGLLGAKQVFSMRVGDGNYPATLAVNGAQVTVAGGDGSVLALDAERGVELWRTSVGERINAGVGSDGKTAAVVTAGNELVALSQGRELWRQKLAAQGFTAPLVAGERVFLLTADRSVTAFDGATGRKLWTQSRPGEALVLRQSGVLLAVADTLVVGLSGRLVGLNPSNGTVRWEANVATSRGTNDVERLVDLVGSVSRVGDSVCTRAFQSAVACVNAARGQLAWTKTANGFEGVHGDDKNVYGSEANGTVQAWSRATGDRVWSTDKLQFRGLSAPLAAGRSIAVGDFQGFLHLLSREDGSLLNRFPTDGSSVVAQPVLAGSTLLVLTRNGGVFGFRPD